MELWQSGDLLKLLQESLTIQRNLKSVRGSKTVAQISKKVCGRNAGGKREWSIETPNRQHGSLNSPFE